MKYLYIQTFGCQMNIHDSDQMAEILKGEGYRKTDDIEKADMVIINTCSIREKAEQKAHSQIGRFRNIKKAKAPCHYRRGRVSGAAIEGKISGKGSFHRHCFRNAQYS